MDMKVNIEKVKELLKQDISEDLIEKLKEAKDDVSICKALADSGIDVEKLQKQVPDEILSQIGGGYSDLGGVEVYCPICGNGDSDAISFQIFASLFYVTEVCRCRKCGNKFTVGLHGEIEYLDE